MSGSDRTSYSTLARVVSSWLWSTFDVSLSMLVLVVIWYPAVTLGNELVGTPLDSRTVTLVLGVLAFASSYVFVTGTWSLGDLGEYFFVLLLSVGVIGLNGLYVLGFSGFSFGDSTLQQAILWTLGYVTAYVVVFRRGPLIE